MLEEHQHLRCRSRSVSLKVGGKRLFACLMPPASNEVLPGRSALFLALRRSLEKRRMGVKLKMNRAVLILKKIEVMAHKRKSLII
jgi:hypothetical protein